MIRAVVFLTAASVGVAADESHGPHIGAPSVALRQLGDNHRRRRKEVEAGRSANDAAKIEKETDKLREDLDTQLKQSNHDVELLEIKVDARQKQQKQKEERVKRLTAELDALRQRSAANNPLLIANITGRQKIATLEDLTLQRQHLVSNLTGKLSKLHTTYHEMVAKYDDPNLQDFLSRKATRVYHHPGIEGAANKTFKYVIPLANDAQLLTNYWVNRTRLQIETHFKKNGALYDNFGQENVDRWLTVFSVFLVYGMVFVPLFLALFCLSEACHAIDTNGMLSFGYFYFAMVNSMASAYAIYTGSDPLATFADHDRSIYFFAQVVFGLILFAVGVYLFTALWQTSPFAVEMRCRRRGSFCVFALIVAAYFRAVWTPAMQDESAEVKMFVLACLGTSDESVVSRWFGFPYAMLTLMFFGLFYLERFSSRDSYRQVSTEPKGE